jgi:hypothetical protein
MSRQVHAAKLAANTTARVLSTALLRTHPHASAPRTVINQRRPDRKAPATMPLHAPILRLWRSDRNAGRISVANSSCSSRAAK